jgi:hypothetical protein
VAHRPHIGKWCWLPAFALAAAGSVTPAPAQEPPAQDPAPAADAGDPDAADAAEPAEAAPTRPAAAPVPEREIVRDVQMVVPILPPPPATELVQPLICPPQLRVFGQCPVLPGSPLVGTRIRVRP